MIEVTMLVEQWSNQASVEITEEDWEMLQKLSQDDTTRWMFDKFPHLNRFDTVVSEIREIKKD